MLTTKNGHIGHDSSQVVTFDKLQPEDDAVKVRIANLRLSEGYDFTALCGDENVHKILKI